MDDLEFIDNDQNWPQWPLLPVKRVVDGKKEVGTIYAGNPTVVMRINMWNLKSQTDIDQAEKNTYPSLIELIADGWRVD